MTAVSSSLGAHHICHVQRNATFTRQHTNKIHLKQITTTKRTTTSTTTTYNKI